MRKFLFFTCVSFFFVLASGESEARNRPCSGHKGGVSHCSGSLFVCKNGSISASHRTCGGGSNSVSSGRVKHIKGTRKRGRHRR